MLMCSPTHLIFIHNTSTMATSQTPFPPSVTKLITPSLLNSLFDLEIPWPKTTPPTTSQWNATHSTPSAYKALCWDTLQELSKIPLETAEQLDFLTLLPDAQDPAFPVLALGLLLLLDQAPRCICTNGNERWRNAFFDPLALRFSLALRDLPQELHIHTFPRWEKLGYTFEHYNALANFLTAPLAHSEDLAIHTTYLLPEVQARRVLTEKHYGVQDTQHAADAAAGIPLAASDNVLEFARMIREGLPAGVGFAEAVFWWCRVKEAHVPIVRIYGGYPYRNRAVGRVTTEKEERFLRDTGDFGVSVDEDAARGIREDVERGVWSPLV